MRKNDVDRNATPNTTARVVRANRSLRRVMFRKVSRNTWLAADGLDSIENTVGVGVGHLVDDPSVS